MNTRLLSRLRERGVLRRWWCQRRITCNVASICRRAASCPVVGSGCGMDASTKRLRSRLRAFYDASSISASGGVGLLTIAARTTDAAPSWSSPLGSPRASRPNFPPTGSGVFAVTFASWSASELQID